MNRDRSGTGWGHRAALPGSSWGWSRRQPWEGGERVFLLQTAVKMFSFNQPQHTRLSKTAGTRADARGCVILIPTFLFQSCVVFSTLIQRLNLLWHIYVYDIFVRSFYLFISVKHSTDKVSSAEAEMLSEGKHLGQTPACAPRVLFYTCHRFQW